MPHKHIHDSYNVVAMVGGLFKACQGLAVGAGRYNIADWRIWKERVITNSLTHVR